MRSFVAIELPAAVRREVGRRVAAARRELPPARWVEPANYHLTLVFLGEIDDSQAEALAARLADVFRRFDAFELRLDRGDCFPSRRPARVAWIGLTPAAPLAALQTEVAAACREELALAPEGRAYHPHLTVARCRRPWPSGAVRRWREATSGAPGPSFAVREGVLMESRLRPAGAVYRPLARLALGDPG